MPTPFVTVPEALDEFARGRMIVVVDDEDRENEGDLTLAADFVTPEAINFMAKFGRGLICLTLTEDRADHLHLGPMSHENTSRFGTAFTASIEAKEGVTTGISAHDRAHTIRVAIDPHSTTEDLARPGHVFPLRARKGGVLVRPGQTEASVDLARLAGLTPAGVICEIMKDDGTMARVPDLIAFCRTHGLKMLTVAELIRYRRENEINIRRAEEQILATQFGDFRAISYKSNIHDDESYTALVVGDVETADSVLVRIHTQCLLGDVFGNSLCKCRQLIEQSLSVLAEEGHGVLVYLHSFGRSSSKEEAAAPASITCTSRQFDSTAERAHEERDLRAKALAMQILGDLGIRNVRLLANAPAQVPSLHGLNLQIVERVLLPMQSPRHIPSIFENDHALSSL